MALTGNRTYVGFGFGAIQAGLFLYEAFCSGNFGRLVVAEVVPEVVAAIRQSGGYFAVNIAHANRIETATIGPIEIKNPADPTDRQDIIDAIAAAEEIGTAIPSVAYYNSGEPGSLHRVLAAGLRQNTALSGPRAVVYTAENHNHAAEILDEAVFAELPTDEQDTVRQNVRFLNTVIGKMSGIIADPAEIRRQNLTRVTPGGQRAFLVEAFNRILISKIRFEDGLFERGLSVFEEKEDHLPFEEAKLYGHNATHALAGYLAALAGVSQIADLPDVPGALPFLRAAFIEESGAALIRKYAGVDPLFTPEGYAAYADDLLERMVNPYLQDAVERVTRDPARKLGWNDRLIGTMRLTLTMRIVPRRYALGTAAALAALDQSVLDGDSPLEPLLLPLWRQASPEQAEQDAVLALIETGRLQMRQWLESGCKNLPALFDSTS